MSTTTNDRTIEAMDVAAVSTPAEGSKVMLLSPSGALTPVTMERLAELVRGTLQVGGRNYVRNSGTVTRGINSSAYNYKVLESTIGAIRKGEPITVSCKDFEPLGGSFDEFRVCLATSGANIRSLVSFDLSEKNKCRTAEVPEDYAGTVNVLVYSGIPGATANKGITVHNLKVERGNVATDWTPAPEDIADLPTENRGGVKSTFPICYVLHPLFSEEKGGLWHERQDDNRNQYHTERITDRCSGGQRIYKRCQRGNRGRGVYDGREFFQSNPECSIASRYPDSIRSWSHESTDICEHQRFRRNVFSSQLVWNRMARLDENHVSRYNRIARRKEVVAA